MNLQPIAVQPALHSLTTRTDCSFVELHSSFNERFLLLENHYNQSCATLTHLLHERTNNNSSNLLLERGALENVQKELINLRKLCEYNQQLQKQKMEQYEKLLKGELRKLMQKSEVDMDSLRSKATKSDEELRQYA